MHKVTSVLNSDVIYERRQRINCRVVNKLLFTPKVWPRHSIGISPIASESKLRNSAAPAIRKCAAKLLAQGVTLVFWFLPDRFALSALVKIFLTELLVRAYPRESRRWHFRQLNPSNAKCHLFSRRGVMEFRVEESRARWAWKYRFKRWSKSSLLQRT